MDRGAWWATVHGKIISNSSHGLVVPHDNVRNRPWALQAPSMPVQEAWVRFLGQEDLLEEEMTTHSSILDWRIPWIEEPGGLLCIGLQRVRHN